MGEKKTINFAFGRSPGFLLQHRGGREKDQGKRPLLNGGSCTCKGGKGSGGIREGGSVQGCSGLDGEGTVRHLIIKPKKRKPGSVDPWSARKG